MSDRPPPSNSESLLFRASRAAPDKRWSGMMPLGCLAVGGVLFWLCAHAPVPWDVGAYFGMVAVGLGIIQGMQRLFPHRTALWGGVGTLLAAVGIFAYGWFDTYESTYRDDGWTITKTYTRWGPTPLFGRLKRGNETQAGPYAPWGKEHGRWIVSEGGEEREIWYWYGKEVTQAEWEKRHAPATKPRPPGKARPPAPR
ncbi:MAG: hypothetical protein ACKV0T_28205 [Planctomycetales bacterium]